MISIVRIDENGRQEAEFADVALLNELFESQAIDAGHCLRFIDEYGDTVFNRLQLPVLAEELRAVAGSVPSLKGRIESLAAFVELAAAAVHTYVKFIGD